VGLNLQNKKIGFFDRLKVAIFKLEDYGMFLGERISTAFKYFFILVLYQYLHYFIFIFKRTGNSKWHN